MRLLRTSTVTMSHEEWLDFRRTGIGGSDAAALVGLNPYSSPYAVWADKLGVMPEVEDNEAMRQGRDLEDYVAKRFAEQTGKKIRRENAIIRNTNYRFALANIDRAIIGERAGLECKTTSSLNLKKFEKGEFPERYYVQCVHYLAVTGWDRWYLAVLVFGKGFYVYTIERDQKEIDALMAAENTFWFSHVTLRIPPVTDGNEATSTALNAVFPGSDGESVVDLDPVENLFDEYAALTATEKTVGERKKAIVNCIGGILQNSTQGASAHFTASYKPQTRETFDRKKFDIDHPGVITPEYIKTTSSRVFRLTARKDKQ